MLVGKVVSKIMSFFNLGPTMWSEEASDTRRRYMRHDGVLAEVTVGYYNYSIRDWSLGGISFETTPDSRLTVGDRLPLVLKFRFPHGTITIEQNAKIVRTARRGIAAEFTHLPEAVRRQFDRVVDSLHAQRFLESQAA
jgi:hypothetical protein